MTGNGLAGLRSSPSVSVIVCTHNRADLLFSCLASLAEQSAPRSSYEVIVVENACSDRTSDVVERFARAYPNFRFLREPTPGKSVASNLGLAHARGRYVAFIDDDARAPRTWVEQIERAFLEPVPEPVVVLGNINSIYEARPPHWWLPVADAPWAQGAAGFKSGGFPVNGSNLAFRKDALRDCGGFAVEHGPVGSSFRLGEDSEAVARVAARYPLVWHDPSLVVSHWVPREKMTLRYLLWRRHMSGLAMSQIEEIRILELGGYLTRRVARGVSGSAKGNRQRHRANVRFVRFALRVALVSGMLRGARLR